MLRFVNKKFYIFSFDCSVRIKLKNYVLKAVVERFGDVYGDFVWDVVVCVGDYGYIFLYIVDIFFI